MKKCFFVILIVSLILTGCVGLAPDAPKTLSLNGMNYQTGFYGTLFPERYQFNGETLDIQDITLNQIAHDDFQLYHAGIGPYTKGTIYCAESDYENALAFYSSPQNYSYYCIFRSSPQVFSPSEIDTDKFDALLAFAERSNYEPFDKSHNAKIEKTEFPMPDEKEIPLCFYKKSIDGLFVSSKGEEYYILNNHLYLVYQYDCGDGEYEKLIAVKVPDDLSTYFIEFVKPYM